MITEFITKLENKQDLTYDETSNAIDQILQGNIADNDSASFLKNLTVKGETDEELLGMLNKMNEHAVHISPKTEGKIIDICGTGGDNMSTFNISTTASFVIAAAGGTVAKHGNRSVSGVSGSADIFEYFGYDLNAPPEQISKIIEEYNIGFMFAQKFHPAMKNVSNARKIVGGKTAFNLLGPLSNPAQVKNQLIGVYSNDFLDRLPKILQKKGAENIMTVRSEDGLDELSTTAKNHVYLLKNNEVESIIFDVEKIGLQKASASDIQIATKEDAITAFVSVLNGTANKSMIEITALNAAGGLIISNLAENFHEGIEMALDTLESGKAHNLLKKFLASNGDIKKLEEIEQK